MKWFLKIAMCVLVLRGFNAMAQDPQFTQFYAAPMYLNPAFTGVTYEHRFVLNYRNQWPGISKAYQTYMASYDYNLSNIKSGLGVIAMQDRSGTSGLTHTQFGVNYAYHANISKFSEIRAGISLSYNIKKLDFNKLRFNDQLVTGSSISNEAANYEQLNYMDIGVGALLNSEQYWLGFSAKHINQPNASLMGDRVPLPVSTSLHGGYRYVIERKGRSDLKRYFSPAFNYRHEAKFDQLDIGVYYYHLPLNVGVWYRGIPFKKYGPTYTSSESIAFLVGTDISEYNLRIGYSYDLTISRLGIINSLGAHEISLIYEIAKKKKRSRRVLVSCPKF
ncbi:MAG: type IX secretion system membrane protein PorP/SprF [Bacteroidetes bacterium]|nr:type IX secretion system membrane protein PorP/SprF [Bacteroidota bacterium]